MPKVVVSGEVFDQAPDFRRGIVVARRMDNRGGEPELEALLAEALSAAAADPFDLKTDPRTAAWNDLYRTLGCNPNKYPPAHLALIKRIRKPGAVIPFISKIVAIMNAGSIGGVLPVGGDDLDQAGDTLELRPAAGHESFTPLDNPEKTERPDPGEIIYVVAETKEVMCRRWNWRNGYPTRITDETRALVMNIDGLGPGNETHTVSVRDRVSRLLERYCGAETETALLAPGAPSFEFRR